MRCFSIFGLLATVLVLTSPLVSAKQKYDANEFDYIVVGGGTAGCVAAARLSEDPRNRVLLVEEGHDNSDDAYTGPMVFPGKIFVDVQNKFVTPARSQESTPNGFSANHYIPLTRTLGGGSAVNGQSYNRLGRQDFDRWNISGWSYDEVRPFQSKVETYSYPDPDGVRGHSGPVNIRRFEPDSLTSNLLQNMARVLNLDISLDLDSDQSAGVTTFSRNTKADSITRESSWTAYLKPIYKSRPNLEIAMDSTVTGIVWKTTTVRNRGVLTTTIDQPLVARSIKYTVNDALESKVVEATVRRELILSAGTMGTPKLLMLSGVGPAAHLESKGIPVVLESERVGQNLQDHIRTPPFQALFANPQNPDQTVQPVAFGRTGLDVSDPDTDFEITLARAATLPAYNVMVGLPVLLHNSGRGSVTLLDRNPRSLPQVDFKFFANAGDAERLIWLAKTTRSILTSTPGFISEIVPSFATVPDGAPDAAWLKWIKNSAAFGGAQSYAHFSSTCSMGTSIKNGVVDSELKMFGSANVRIADMSVLPGAVGKRPFGTALMVGERVADFVQSANL